MLLTLALLACSPEEAEDTGPIDARAEAPAAPAGAMEFVATEETIPAYSERQFCTFFDYEGEDVGIVDVTSYQDPDYGHHALLLTTLADEPHGSTIDCTAAEDFNMARTETLYMPKPQGPGQIGTTMPEGFGIKLRAGKRLVLQSHYINPTDRPMRVQDVVHVTTKPVDEIETWAAAYAHSTLDLDVAPGEDAEIVLDCEWNADLNLMFLLGHMHEWGTAFSVDHVRTDGTTERIYDIPEWLPEYRDLPPIEEYGDTPYQVSAGDRFVTTCSWHNDTDETLEFPYEMCATVGLAWPAESALYCAEF